MQNSIRFLFRAFGMYLYSFIHVVQVCPSIGKWATIPKLTVASVTSIDVPLNGHCSFGWQCSTKLLHTWFLRFNFLQTSRTNSVSLFSQCVMLKLHLLVITCNWKVEEIFKIVYIMSSTISTSINPSIGSVNLNSPFIKYWLRAIFEIVVLKWMGCFSSSGQAEKLFNAIVLDWKLTTNWTPVHRIRIDTNILKNILDAEPKGPERCRTNNEFKWMWWSSFIPFLVAISECIFWDHFRFFFKLPFPPVASHFIFFTGWLLKRYYFH